MRYVPEELYLTWKERAEVSRRYALAVEQEYETLRKNCSQCDFKVWSLNQEVKELKSIPVAKIYKRLLKTQQRLYKAKQQVKELQEKLNTITDVLTN